MVVVPGGSGVPKKNHACVLQVLPVELQAKRIYSGCGLFQKPDGSRYAMVVGGGEEPLASTEILDLQTMELQSGKMHGELSIG